MVGGGFLYKRTRTTPFLISTTMSEQRVPSSVAQRIIIKFLTTEGVKPSDILRRLKAQFEDNILKKTQVYAWHKKFLGGRTAVENEAHLRRPRTSVTQENIDVVRRLVEGDSRLPVAEITSEVGISYGSAQAMLCTIVNFWKKQNSHIVGKDAWRQQLETFFVMLVI